MRYMVEKENWIKLNYTDKDINKRLTRLSSEDLRGSEYTCHFNQNEDFFINLSKDIEIPSFNIHHDIRQKSPTIDYLNKLKNIIPQIIDTAPDLLYEMTWFFDNTEILKPSFFRLYKFGDDHYLYLLRFNLICRQNEMKVISNGTNDRTPVFETHKLYLESDFIPLDEVRMIHDKIDSFKVKKLISETWLGEEGRGYFLQGIWIDSDLSKFFTRLVAPEKGRIYPYFPYTCKYQSICQTIIPPTRGARKKLLPLLHDFIKYIGPYMDTIQEQLKEREFSETLEIFQKFKRNVPDNLKDQYCNVKSEIYLNENEQREYVIEFN